MDNAAVIILAGLCLGIALTGCLSVLVHPSSVRQRAALAVIYVAFMGLTGLPLIRAFAAPVLTFYLPVLLILLLILPPAFYHFVLAKTDTAPPARIPWRDRALPLIGLLVCIGFWVLPTQAKDTLFLAGDLPPGVWPAALALITFGLILIWLVTSPAYLVAVLRRLAAYRARIRQLYSNLEKRDLRWVDLVMGLLVVIWAAGAVALADDNLGDGTLLDDAILLVLTACCLLALNIFAGIAPPEALPGTEASEPDLKYARSALTEEHTAKLAQRIEAAMQKDALYLDPGLSLQKLSQHIGAVPNQVSQTLNQEIGASFFDYVARWRIMASKPQVAAGEASVLTIAFAVGFNSRSTFYKAFKRETGMTPKDYRRAHGNAV